MKPETKRLGYALCYVCWLLAGLLNAFCDNHVMAFVCSLVALSCLLASYQSQ